MSTDSGDVATIACDESASEGENLMASAHPVFVHGSVHLGVDEANALMDHLRKATRTQAPELKSKTILAPRHRSNLLAALAELDNRANIYMVDKSYFLTAKLIDLVIAERAATVGYDLAASGAGRDLADYLHRVGPSAVGNERWSRLLASYNDLIRSYLRRGAQAPTAEPFFSALKGARAACSDSGVSDLLDGVWHARMYVLEYEGMSRVELRELDPMAPSLASVSMTWSIRLDGQPFEFLVDDYSTLSEEVRDSIVEASRVPLSIRDTPLPRADLRAIRMIDSKSDARVQVADIVAGVGRRVAELAIEGTLDDDLQNVVHQMLDFNVMCSTGSPLDVLTERRPLAYLQGWMERS